MKDLIKQEILAGLLAQPKRTSPKYFYDQRGSELFEAITHTPEYYVTRTEIGIYRACRKELGELVGTQSCLIEYGSGSSRKIRLLLNAIRPRVYVGIDISRDFLNDAVAALGRDHPGLITHAVCADITQPFGLPANLSGLTKVAFYPGSSIGNFEPVQAAEFLGRIAKTVGTGGELIIGVDRKKETKVLEAAYNDDERLTERFNLNILSHLNTQLNADFDLAQFKHVAGYNHSLGCIQMFLESVTDQSVTVAGEKIEFVRGEKLHTENSYKYHPDEFLNMAAAAGFTLVRHWTDTDEYFSVYLLKVGV